jgi:hypothetical protein
MSIKLKLPSQKQFNGDRAQDYSVTPIYNENSQKEFRVINNGIGIVPHVSIPIDPEKAYVKQFHDPSITSGIVVGKGRRKMGMGKLNPSSSKNPLGNTEKQFGQALPMAHGKGYHMKGGRKMLAGSNIIHGDVPTMQGRYHLMPYVHHGGDFSGVNRYGAYKGGVPNIIPY